MFVQFLPGFLLLLNTVFGFTKSLLLPAAMCDIFTDSSAALYTVNIANTTADMQYNSDLLHVSTAPGCGKAHTKV